MGMDIKNKIGDKNNFTISYKIWVLDRL